MCTSGTHHIGGQIRERPEGERRRVGLAAGCNWEDNDLVFCTSLGRPLDRGNVGRAFKLICKRAGIRDAEKRVPYELRHTYASIVHDSGVPAEEVAQQLGHSRTAVFEMVYRHVLKPRRREGQAVVVELVRSDPVAAYRVGGEAGWHGVQQGPSRLVTVSAPFGPVL